MPSTNGIDIPDPARLKTTANIIVVVSTDKVILCKYAATVLLAKGVVFDADDWFFLGS
jgi:hypothetical protein